MTGKAIFQQDRFFPTTELGVYQKGFLPYKKKKMKLLIDARMYSSHFTGIGRYVYEMTNEFFRQKPDWEFVLFMGENEYKNFTPPSKNIKKILAPEKIYSLGEQTSFLMRMMKQDADMTWFPHFTVPLVYPRKFCITVHDLTISKFPGKKMNSLPYRLAYKTILKNALCRSEKIFAVSENTKQDIINDEKISEEKIFVHSNAVGKEFTEFEIDPLVDLKKFGIEENFFLYTGQWREHKNIVGMIQAFHTFLKKSGKNFQLVITGKENPLYPEFLEYRKKYNLEESVISVGLVDEKILKHLYAKANAFVFPSFYEGFGIPPLEAMAVSTPVIASNASCIPEVCGSAAEYFDPKNTEEMAQKMEKISSDQDLREELIEKGRTQVQKFSWEKSARKILTELEQAV